MEITHAEIDPTPGGRWRSCMQRPGGEPLWFGGVYRRVVPDELIEFTHAWDHDNFETLVTVRLQDAGAKTRMTFRQEVFSSQDARDRHHEGWSSCFGRLASLLQPKETGS